MGFINFMCFLGFLLVGSALGQNTVCPFDFLFHLGDSVFDNGNAIRTLPFGPSLPAAHPPYDQTTPGTPTGRWSDGLLDIDVGATAMGFPVLTPYKGGNATNNNAIIFAVAGSPVLNRTFFQSRGVRIPPYAAPLSTQMSWFHAYLDTVCSTPTECADRLADSLFLFGDVEANDITIPLIQGKSIEEVTDYVAYVTSAQINAAREVIEMGGARVIIPGNNPMGCFPFILTELASNQTTDYDEYGCLKSVNDLVIYKNNHLQSAVANLSSEFPDTTIFYADFYTAFIELLQEVDADPCMEPALQTCCGIGGDYNYNSTRFCGSSGVPVCSDPNKYIYWDGINLTEFANTRLSAILQVGARETLNCTTSTSQFNPIRQVVGNSGNGLKSSMKLIRM